MQIKDYRKKVIEAEEMIIEIIDGKYHGIPSRVTRNTEDYDLVSSLLETRAHALSSMFRLHCTDTEVRLIEQQNTKLARLTEDMYARTGKVFRHVLDNPIGMDLDDVEVIGTLSYWGDDEDDVLCLGDDVFYGSDFRRMIPIVTHLDKSAEGIICCHPRCKTGKTLLSTITDKDLGLEDMMDDGTTWAEGSLRHKKLDHIVMCYATHRLVCDGRFSIPDYIRLKSFTVEVDVRLQKFED